MMRNMLVAAGMVLFLLWSGRVVATTYTVRQLGMPSGATTAWACGVNDEGQVAGFANYTAWYDRYAVYWDTNGMPTKLKVTAGGEGSEAIDSNGNLIGYTDADRGFIWNPSSGYKDLGSFLPVGINRYGDIVGFSMTTRTYSILTYSGSYRDLPCLRGYSYVVGFASNLNGTAVGEIDLDQQHSYPCKWSGDGFPTILPNLGGAWSTARRINDAGQVVGYSMKSGGGQLACLWSADNSLTVLPCMPYQYFPYASAHGINASGTIVGVSNGPVFWEAGTHAIAALPLLPGCTGGEAIDISDSGYIVGYCSDSTGEHSVPVIWTPVPEPSCLAMLLGGIAGATLILRRKRQTN